MHTVKWFWVLLFNTNNSWPIDGTLTGTTAEGQSGRGSNSNEGVLHICQSSRTGPSPSDRV